MSDLITLHEDRLFPAEPAAREVARRLYNEIKDKPIISPHGHTDPSWFADNENFPNPAELLIIPDHYVFRMLYSQGISLEALGIPHAGADSDEATNLDPREIWRLFARHFYLFRGTPSSMWLNWVFREVFGLEQRLSEKTADFYYDRIDQLVQTDDFKPRALMDRFNIEVIATTEDPLDPLEHHAKLKSEGWGHRVLTAYRPDNVVDPEYENFSQNLDRLGEISGFDTSQYDGYLNALAERRGHFKNHGATSSDHGHPTAFTADLSRTEAEGLFARVRHGKATPQDAELFRGHMLTEMARMSVEDGLVMQIHPGSYRNHNGLILSKFGRDKGADIPTATDYVRALKPLLNKYGNNPEFNLIIFTLDETSYSRELAPLAGHYPCLKLGPAWWFHDSPEGMRRFREQVTETAGFYNTVGFNDDTRAFLSIPARHDVARRCDCAFLARLVVEHRLAEDEALEVATDLTYNLAKQAYKL
ncbi:MAG: glucuronate isomerase [Henriciella sp.]|nr:glucuronate isomerase [Henriciella sp.]